MNTLAIEGTAALAAVETQTQELNTKALGLVATAKTYAVTTPDEYHAAGLFYTSLKNELRTLDNERKSYTDPLNQTVKRINADYKRISDAVESAIKIVNDRMVAFKREEERQRREAEEAARRERLRIEAEANAKVEAEIKRMQEERRKAEELAAAQAKAANPIQAFVVEQQRAEAEAQAAAAKLAADQAIRAGTLAKQTVVVDAPPKVTAAGTSFRKVWKFRIVNAALIPREYLIPDEKRLGLIARTDKEGASVPGVEFYADEIIAG